MKYLLIVNHYNKLDDSLDKKIFIIVVRTAIKMNMFETKLSRVSYCPNTFGIRMAETTNMNTKTLYVYCDR